MAKAEAKTDDKVDVESAADLDVVESKPVNRSPAPLWDLEGEFERAFENFCNRDSLRTPRSAFA